MSQSTDSSSDNASGIRMVQNDVTPDRRPTDSPTCTRPSEQWTSRRVFLLLGDNIISILVIGPLTVFYWHGTWRLLDRHLFPDMADANGVVIDGDFLKVNDTSQLTPVASKLDGWICLVVGNVGLVLMVYLQTFFDRCLKADNLVHWLIGFHTYTYVLAFLNVCHWRGVWVLVNRYCGVSIFCGWTTYAIGQCGLWLLRSSRNASAPPMLVVTDWRPNFFAYSTRFNAQLVATYWVGVWMILDIHLYPHNMTFSASLSLTYATIIQLVICTVQPPLNVLYNMCSRSRGTSGCLQCWLLETVVFYFTNLATVGHWRGVWIFLGVYAFPDMPDISAGVTHVVGLVGLWLIGAGHSVTLTGCLVDGESTPEVGCLVKNDYVSHLVSRCRRTHNKMVVDDTRAKTLSDTAVGETLTSYF